MEREACLPKTRTVRAERDRTAAKVCMKDAYAYATKNAFVVFNTSVYISKRLGKTIF